MLVAFSVVAIVACVALCLAALWMAMSALKEVKELRLELDETQRQLNELKAAAEVVPAPPPPLPRARSSGLDDLREQLRAAHREEGSEE